jgi:hypothetical protein
MPAAAAPSVDFSRVNKVARKAQIQKLDLVKATCAAALRPESIANKAGQYFISQTVKHSFNEAMKEIESFVAYRVVVRGTPDGVEWANFAPTFRVAYTLSDTNGIEGEDIKAFAEVNSIFNSWPYLREFIQSTALRMGFPGLVVHLFKITPPEPQKPKQAG